MKFQTWIRVCSISVVFMWTSCGRAQEAAEADPGTSSVRVQYALHVAYDDVKRVLAELKNTGTAVLPSEPTAEPAIIDGMIWLNGKELPYLVKNSAHTSISFQGSRLKQGTNSIRFHIESVRPLYALLIEYHGNEDFTERYRFKVWAVFELEEAGRVDKTFYFEHGDKAAPVMEWGR